MIICLAIKEGEKKVEMARKDTKGRKVQKKSHTRPKF